MRKWLAVLMMVGLMAAGLTGCGSKPPANETQTPTSTNQTQTQTGTDLSSIMKSASGMKQMSFDTVTTLTSGGQTITSTGKFYMSDAKLRMETEMQGMKSIMITKSPGEVYIYNPTTKTAMKITSPPETADLPNTWAKASGDTTGYKVLGEEKKDGFDCLVVQYTDPANAAITSKMWLRKDNGLPVRVESASAEGAVVTEYKNYNLGAQDASLFELPAGTQITAMPSIPNLPNLPQ